MYNRFFGFRERPFQLVPNPTYLYLSRGHEEALAHLSYAISQGDGFVEITGEVGTGKTTLCRAFLDSLDDDTEAAYIFNPKLDAVQLLKAINDEFGIPSGADDTKELIDVLNVFLMENKAKGKKIILLIDEAQNLSKEVLEQLRLLSNLETTTSKLLQIILVGQPELAEMLDSYELRQLGQRITLSCHLSPLTFKESREYIRHRIQVASQKSTTAFSRGAMRVLYRYSGGIPRLINIACDRSLLTAYGLNKKKITSAIARASIRELAGRGDVKQYGIRDNSRTLVALSLLVLALAALLVYQTGLVGMILPPTDSSEQEQPKKSAVQSEVKKTQKKATALVAGDSTPVAGDSTPGVDSKVSVADSKESVADKKMSTADKNKSTADNKEAAVEVPSDSIVVEQASKDPEAKERLGPPSPTPDVKRIADTHEIKTEPAVTPRLSLGERLLGLSSGYSRQSALKAAMDLWLDGSTVISPDLETTDDQTFFRLAARQNGLLIHRIEGGLDLLRSLNLPSILEFTVPEGVTPRYLTVTKLGVEGITLSGGKESEPFRVRPKEVTKSWTGVAYIPWKNFLNYTGVIPRDAPRESIITLKMLMQDLGFKEMEVTPFYDQKTRDAIKQIQQRHGIKVDGVVGPMTKMVLYNEKKSLKIPHILN